MARKWWTLVVVCTGIFMLLLDVTVVNVALPDIQKDLHASFSQLQWVIDAYALSLAALTLTAGSLADLLGRKRIFALGVVIFTGGSLLCGVAPTANFLIVARGLQGVGGATMFAVSLALLAHEFHGAERGTAFGIWGATTGGAVAIGPLVGGLITEWIGWRWIFLVNVPIGAAALAITLLKVEESRDPEHGGIDIPGVITFTGGLFLLVFGLVRGNNAGWTSPQIMGVLIGSAVLLAAFVLIELRSRRPMLDLHLFRRPAFVGAQVAAFTLSASAFSMFLYFTLYLQNVLGYSPLQAGLRFLPITLFSFVVAPISGKLSAHTPVRLLIGGGLAVITLAFLVMHGLTASSGWTALLPGFILLGAGVGLVNPPLASTAVGVVPPQSAGMGSGANSTFRQVGIATGIAALGAAFEHHLTSALGAAGHGVASGVVPPGLREQAKAAFVGGMNELFLISAAIAAVGAVSSFFLIRRRDFYGRH
ncbi:MAG TPA: MFS transporter [Gaiellaceae bacterium]|nr:MFS transporter [Gaiellaceae bacterium]